MYVLQILVKRWPNVERMKVRLAPGTVLPKQCEVRVDKGFRVRICLPCARKQRIILHLGLGRISVDKALDVVINTSFCDRGDSPKV